MLNKELAEIIIFNSIFENIKKGGFNYLEDNLEIVEPQNTILDKFIDLNNSDYAYLKKAFNKVPKEYTLKYAGISNNFNSSAQEDWFRKYVETPNKFVIYTISAFINSLIKNSRLKSKLDPEFLEYLASITGQDIKEFTNSEDTKEFLFSYEEFQDLIFITFAETIYNPEIEDEVNTKFSKSNKLFWNRFNELYRDIFIKKFGENDIINQGFFLDKSLMEYKKRYGFDIFDDVLDSSAYPQYPEKYLPYFNFPSKEYNNKVNDEEYIDFRKKEFALYNDLCDKYGILKTRTKMM